MLGVALPGGTLAGFVSWRTITAGGPDGGCLEIGALVFPEHRGHGLGTARGLAFLGGRWRDCVLYARLRGDPDQ